MICLSLCCNTIEEVLLQVKANLAYIDAVELRADYLRTSEYKHIARFPAHIPASMTSILTLRRTCDGGLWKQDEKSRIALMKKNAEYFTYCDIETDYPNISVASKIIRSLHDFAKIPDNLEVMLCEQSADIVKAACTLNSTADLLSLWNIAQRLKNKGLAFTLIGMGDYGTITRILTKKMGSAMTYVSHAAPIAHGHISVERMSKCYRYNKITEKTKVFGIIGNPVLHSESPFWHNTRFADKGIDAVYVPITLDDVQLLKPLIETIDIHGLSVTVPHKTAVMPVLDDQSEELNTIGACNTIVRHNNRLKGYNSDAGGFYRTLGMLKTVKRAALIGAGGAARAILYALYNISGIEICVFSRSPEKAMELTKVFPALQTATLDNTEMLANYAELIVQCTTLGMDSNPGDPIAQYTFTGNEVVYDIIYIPEYTALLERAKRAGCKVINGMEMLHAQAEEQSKLFIEVA